MILYKFKEKFNDRNTGSRWVFMACLKSTWPVISVGFYHQYNMNIDTERYSDRVDDESWYLGGRYYDISVTPHFSVGRRRDYYDGPHDSFSLGFLHVNWSADWCQKVLL